MKGEYDLTADRNGKEKAYSWAFSRLGKDAFRCVLMMPSVTCLDIRMLSHLFGSDTKFIFVENFKYIHCTEREWRRTVLDSLPDCVDEKNVHFHCGELDDLQLGAAMRSLGAQEVDFAFFDLCGELSLRQYDWLWSNRCLFSERPDVLFTIDLQPSIINDCSCFDMRMAEDPKYARCARLMSVDGSNITPRVERSARGWCFTLQHAMDGRHKGRCDAVVYKSGGERHRMLLAKPDIFINGESDYRHAYYRGFFRKSSTLDESILSYDGIDWGGYGTTGLRNYSYQLRSNDVLLFQEMGFDNASFDYRRFMDYLLSGKGRHKPADMRRFRPDRMKNCVSACAPCSFPPEKYDSRYKSTRLYFARCEQVFRRLVAGRKIRYDGMLFKFTDGFRLMFKDEDGKWRDYLDEYAVARGMYNRLNCADCGDEKVKTLK